MPSISGAVEWGIKCCDAPTGEAADDPDFNYWYAEYDNYTFGYTFSNGWVGARRNMGAGNYNGNKTFCFDCMSFCNIALCLGGGFPQYGDEGFDFGYCFGGEGWDNAINNSIAGSVCQPWLELVGFERITDTSEVLLPGDVVLTSYDSNGNPGHMEMVWEEGGNIVQGGHTMGAHYLDRPLADMVNRTSGYNFGTASSPTSRWFRYMGPDEGGSGGHHGSGTGTGGNKHRAWLYLRNPRLYNLRR